MTLVNIRSNFIASFLELYLDFDPGANVARAVADPDGVDLVPFSSALLDREPRSGHEVDAFDSEPGPEVFQPDALDGSADLRRLQAAGLVGVQVLLLAQGHTLSAEAQPLDTVFVHQSHVDPGVGV